MTARAVVRTTFARRRRRSLTATVGVAALVFTGSAVAVGGAAQAAVTDGCFATDVTVERWQDSRGVTVFTKTDAQEAAAAEAGFTPTGDAFAASGRVSRAVIPLTDAYRPSTENHAWILWTSELGSVVANGWENRGAIANVSIRPLSNCDTQVKMTRAVRGSLHTVVVGDAEAAAAVADGYRLEYSWYVPAAPSELGTSIPPAPTPTPTPTPEPTPTSTPTPAPEPPAPHPQPGPGDGDGSFTIATYPDTQQEVFTWAGTRFVDRTKWLVSQKDALDLRFVAHIGDVVNFDTDGHEQFVVAETAMDPLEAAGIPYQLSIGNHDTLATGPGGGARDPKLTRVYQRTTTTFNDFWSSSDYGAVAGEFEAGKVDNTFSTFSAEGADWLVLNLELWPRVAAVDWAENVIKAHAGSNVIIQTHSFLSASADIESAGQSVTRYAYGDSSPQYVYDRLVAPYSNVKVVMSGHIGGAASKVHTTANGNEVAFMLQTMHSNTNNPTRLSKFDVAAGTIDTRVYAPEDGATVDVKTLTGLTFIR